jgi:hypothetical protein
MKRLVNTTRRLLLLFKSNQGGTGKRKKKGEESIKSNQSRLHQLATERTGRMEMGAKRRGQNGNYCYYDYYCYYYFILLKKSNQEGDV